MHIKALIIDDEPQACQHLHAILTRESASFVQIVGMASSTAEAALLLERFRPDAVFIDIDMPHENAFQFLERTGPVPYQVVFVTAYDEFAVRAFRLNALDYILKPLDPEEVRGAVHKLRNWRMLHEQVRHRAITDAGRHRSAARQESIILRNSNHQEVILFTNILYVEAMRSYSRFVYRDGHEEKSLVMSYPITNYEDLLPGHIFFRAHRSYIVNVGFVSRICNEDAPCLVLSNHDRLPIGRRRYAALLSFMKSDQI